MVKYRIQDRELAGSIPGSIKCGFLEQDTLSTLLSSGFYPGMPAKNARKGVGTIEDKIYKNK